MPVDVRTLVSAGLPPVQAQELAAQIDGGANAVSLLRTGLEVAQAQELAAQITAGIGNASRLITVGLYSGIAREIATAITDGSLAPFNLKASNTVNLRAGLFDVIDQTADRAIVSQSDSTDRGKGSGIGADFQNGWIPKLAQLLRSSGFVPYATWDSLFGTGNMIPGDNRWANVGTTTNPASIGGSMWQIDASGEGMTFTPVEPKNTYGLLHFDNNSMRFNARVNAETPLVVDGTTGTRFALLSTAAPGPHTITVEWEASTVRFMAIDAYDSAVKQLKFWNASVSGAKASDFLNETQAYAPGSMSKTLSGLACCFILACGKNEMRQNVTPASYATDLSTQIDNARSSGTCDVLLHTPVPDGDDGTFAYPLSDYIAKIYEVSIAKDVPVIKVNEALGRTWAVGNVLGYYNDSVGHLLPPGNEFLANGVWLDAFTRIKALGRPA